MSQTERNERAEQRVGAVICNRWRLEELLGVGGMAAVYAATHRNGSRVALKLLHPELAEYADIRERFLEEGYAANRVGPPGIVGVLDEGVAEDGGVFLVMELLRGQTLEEMCASGAQPSLGDTLRVADEVLGVLERGHAKGVVHRDIKPENVFITRAGEIKLLDFGIARVTDSRRSHATEPGSAMGTPAFMPPEQARGRWDCIDERTDLWALGATIFWTISGRFVHEATTVNEELLLAMTVRARSLAVVAPSVPSALVRFVDRALEFDPAQRFGSAREMRLALRKTLEMLNERELGEPTLARRSSDVSPDGPTLEESSALPSVRPVTSSYRAPPDRIGLRALGLAAALALFGGVGWAWLSPRPSALPSPPPLHEMQEEMAAPAATPMPTGETLLAAEPPVVVEDLGDIDLASAPVVSAPEQPKSKPAAGRWPRPALKQSVPSIPSSTAPAETKTPGTAWDPLSRRK